MFTSSVGTAIDPNNLLHEFKGLLSEFELPPHRLHDLRHTAASLMLAQGTPLHVVSKILGHASIRVTMDVYGHIYDRDFQLAADRMDAVMGGG